MDAAAKQASLYKLHKIDNKVAYPEKWRDYSKLQIGKESLLANLRAAAAFETARDLAKIGKPLDRGEWRMTPPTVNAYYSASLNEMVFPAGIMQLPFFSPEAPVASNYGGLGMVMGHELTHGFDDQGRKFDGDGNLHEWWSPEVNKAFVERAECVAKQYDGYVAVDDVHLNGHLTLGENIGDIGGLKMMIAALRERSASALRDRGTAALRERSASALRDRGTPSDAVPGSAGSDERSASALRDRGTPSEAVPGSAGSDGVRDRGTPSNAVPGSAGSDERSASALRDRGTPSEAVPGSAGSDGVPGTVGGFNSEQQAFIAFGQVWCTNYRPEAARTQALTNPHSTAQWRVNGPVSDTPDFAAAFSCKPGSPMAPVNHCTVW
jgi:predicted metalloendopeptidase